MGVGGWLLLLCALLVLWEPVQLAFIVSGALSALPVRGATLAALIVVRIAVAALGVAAGLALLTRREPALTLTRLSLVATATTDAFVALTPYFPSNRMPGDEWIDVGARLAFAAAWLTYLQRSRRVRHTFD